MSLTVKVTRPQTWGVACDSVFVLALFIPYILFETFKGSPSYVTELNSHINATQLNQSYRIEEKLKSLKYSVPKRIKSSRDPFLPNAALTSNLSRQYCGSGDLFILGEFDAVG